MQWMATFCDNTATTCAIKCPSNFCWSAMDDGMDSRYEGVSCQDLREHVRLIMEFPFWIKSGTRADARMQMHASHVDG